MTKRALPIALIATAATLSAAQAASAFSLGVAASEVRATSALLWSHADSPGGVRLEVATDRAGHRIVLRRRLRAQRFNDLTVQTLVKRLRPATRYFYRFRQGRRVSDVGEFVTAPPTLADAEIKFAVSGDTDAQKAPGAPRPYYNNFEIYKLMARERNDFNVNFGDTIYSDSEVPGVWPGLPDALTLQEKWAKYRQNLALANLQLLRGSGASYSHWDDHEFINDFTPGENRFSTGNDTDHNTRTTLINGHQLYEIGMRAFRDYMPVTYSRARGIYRSFRWGRNLEVFFPDERSFRGPKADANDACDNPNTGASDLAPTADGTLARTEFGLLVRGARGPVTQRCKDSLNDPRRAFLGAAQLARFEQAIKASTATFKVIMNELPIQQYYALPYDRWEGYPAERTALLRFLADNVKNVVFLTTDVHANLVNDVRFQTLEPGGVKDSGILEVTTGPVATMTYNKEINGTVGNPLVGPLVATLVFKAPPPQGVGMKCAQIDQYSYMEVSVSGRRLRIDLKGIDGKPITDLGGGACGPFVLPKR